MEVRLVHLVSSLACVPLPVGLSFSYLLHVGNFGSLGSLHLRDMAKILPFSVIDRHLSRVDAPPVLFSFLIVFCLPLPVQAGPLPSHRHHPRS